MVWSVIMIGKATVRLARSGTQTVNGVILDKTGRLI